MTETGNDKVSNAIELKAFVESIPRNTKPIGSCVSRTFAFYEDQDGPPPGYTSEERSSSESSPDNKKACRHGDHSRTQVHRAIEDLCSFASKQNATSTMNHTCWSTDDFVTIHVADVTIPLGYALRRDVDVLQKLYEFGSPSSFGNVKELKTVVDESIRKAREFSSDAFTVSDALCRRVESMWGECMVPAKVKAVPYKVNVYGEGDKFDTHRDTPGPGLVGTFLVGLGDTSTEGGLVVGEDRWDDTRVGSWCAFYTDVPHSVEPVQGGYRANIAFKIYADGPQEPGVFPPEMVQRVSKLLSETTNAIGILLSHSYSLNAAHLKGVDKMVYDMFQHMGFSHTAIIPVLVTEEGTREPDSDEEGHYSSFVYAIDGTQPWMGDDISFYEVSQGYCWSLHHQSYAAHTGNESQPEEIESIYLSRALIVKK